MLPALLAAVSSQPLAAQGGAPLGVAAYDSAFYAWERGDYVEALMRLDRLLGGADAARYHDAAAELTGEVHVTRELAVDGRAVRWSPDSRHAAWESGTGAARRTHVVALAAGTIGDVVVLEGTGAAFDGAGRVGWIGGAGAVVVRDLASGRDTRIETPGINSQAVIFRPGHAGVFVVAPSGGGSNDVYRIDGGAPERLTQGPGTKTALRWVTSDLLLYGIDRGSFAIEDVNTGSVRTVAGAGATASADGSTVAWIAEEDGLNVLRVFRAADGAPRALVRTADALAAPALSRDGRRIVVQRMPREDWELFRSMWRRLPRRG
jgi:hypothetical protein